MAGIKFLGTGDLFYFAIDKSTFKFKITDDLFFRLCSLSLNYDPFDLKTNFYKTSFFNFDQEDGFRKYLQTLDKAITHEEVSFFFHGSKRIPFDEEWVEPGSVDDEDYYWEIEVEKIEKIIQQHKNFNLQEISKFVFKHEDSIEDSIERNKDDFDFSMEYFMEPINFIISRLLNNQIVLCLWDQS